MKLGFISDFYNNQINGGAENNDSVLIEFLKTTYDVQCLYSKDVKPEAIINYDFFIVSNFTMLSEEAKNFIQTKDYIIYEHDHKYVSNRDPSKFVDFNIDDDNIINKDFYINAKTVVVLSEICKSIIVKNLGLSNVVNIGTSLWSRQSLELIESLQTTEKNGKHCVVSSKNPIKNQAKAEKYCISKGISYDLIGSSDYREFVEQLSSYSTLVFVPGVIETYSRLVCEAKMLGCQVLTNKKLIGFASEDIYDLSGNELLKQIENRVTKALNIFVEEIERPREIKEYICILSLWKRGQWLSEQIDCLLGQSVPPKEIWICHGKNSENSSFLNDEIRSKVDKIVTIEDGGSIFSRFEMATKNESDYYFIIDDDMFPSKHYISNCMKLVRHTGEAIFCSSGRIFKSNEYFPNEMLGSIRYTNSSKVDIGTNGWLLTGEAIELMLNEHNKIAKNNGEDIAISYLNRTHRDVESYVIKQTKFVNSDIHRHSRGVGEEALSHPSNHNQFYSERNKILSNYIFEQNSNWFFRNLQNKIPFAFSRFNDGEMMTISGINAPISRGGQKYDSTLSVALRESLIFEQKNYFKGIPLESEYKEHYKLASKLIFGHKHVVDAVCLIKYDWRKFVEKFVEFFKNKSIIWISGEDQDTSWFEKNEINISKHYKFKNKNSWDIYEQIKKVDISSSEFVFISLGPTGRVLVKDLFEKNPHKTIVEFGSTFDPFTRNIHYSYQKEQNMAITFKYNSKTFNMSCISDNDHQAKYWKKNEFYELRLLNKIKSLGLKGTYLDIGANLGNHTVYFSNFTQAENIISFEPNPVIVKYLEKNCSTNCNNTKIFNFGLSNKEDVLYMNDIDPNNCGSTRIQEGGKTKIIVKTVDQLGLDNISLMKIDVEGFEKQVILGAIQTIKKNKPVIFTELATVSEFNQMSQLMEKLGYSTDRVNYANTPTYMWTSKT